MADADTDGSRLQILANKIDFHNVPDGGKPDMDQLFNENGLSSLNKMEPILIDENNWNKLSENSKLIFKTSSSRRGSMI